MDAMQPGTNARLNMRVCTYDTSIHFGFDCLLSPLHTDNALALAKDKM
jgi:hypothetical protein